jgi:hypothetical protein
MFVIPILINFDTLDIAVTIEFGLDYSQVRAAIAAPAPRQFAYLEQDGLQRTLREDKIEIDSKPQVNFTDLSVSLH